MLSLLARIGLDASGYAAGLKRTESLTNAWGKRLGSSVKSQLAAAFGVAAITSALRNSLKDAERISDAAGKHGLTPEQFQAITYAADATGQSLDEVLKKLVAAGTEMDKLRGKDLAKVFEDIDKPLSNAIARAKDLGLVLENAVIERMNMSNTRMEELMLRARGPVMKVMESIVSTFENIGAVHAGVSNVMKRKNERTIPERIKAIFTGQTFSDYAEGRDAYTQKIWDSLGMQMPTRREAPAPVKESVLSSVEPREESQFRVNRASVNSLQSIGAFVASNPSTIEVKNHTVLKEIARNTKKSPAINDDF